MEKAPSQFDVHQTLRANASNLWKATPATLATHLSGGAWQPAQHLLFISKIVAHAIYQGFKTGEGKKIIISVPPRHGKSYMLSVWSPIWILEHWPWAHIMTATYGADLATDFSRETRDLCIKHEDQLSFKLKSDTKQVVRWMTEAGGGEYAVGVGGPLTGRGANVLLVDDYIKNAQEAASKTVRDNAYTWFTSTAFTRLEPGGTVIIIATRWNKDDVSGRLLKLDDGWIEINLPALAEDNDPIGRQKGEALWPERYTAKTLTRIKNTVGPYFWNSLFKQDPQEDNSGLIDTSKIHIIPQAEVPPLNEMVLIRAWDQAATPTDNVALDPDWTVGLLIGWHPASNIFYILSIVRVQKSPAGIELTMQTTTENDSEQTMVVLEQEPGSAGKNNVYFTAKYVLEDALLSGIRSTGPKLLRAQGAFAALEMGLIKVVEGSHVTEFINEVGSFPAGDHDDQVDALSLGYSELKKYRKQSATWGRKKANVVAFPQGGKLHNTGATFGRRS